jgi:hypothetical protein
VSTPRLLANAEDDDCNYISTGSQWSFTEIYCLIIQTTKYKNTSLFANDGVTVGSL